jgi:hypothetical protein
MPRFFIARPSKIYPNWDFWFENKPSGNPGANAEISVFRIRVEIAPTKQSKSRKQCKSSQYLQQHCHVTLKNLKPWRDSNPGLMFFRQMR